MSRSIYFKAFVFLVAFVAFAIPASKVFAVQSGGGGGATANGCAIIGAYIPDNDEYVRFSATPQCGSVTISDSQGANETPYSAYNQSSVYNPSSEENGVAFIPLSYTQGQGTTVTFTVVGHDAQNWSDTSTATVTFDANAPYNGKLCSFPSFSYAVSAPGYPNSVGYSIDTTGAGPVGKACKIVFNGSVTAADPITNGIQSGQQNTLQIWAVPAGGSYGDPSQDLQDSVGFNNPARFSYTPPATTATINVSIVTASGPAVLAKNVNWVIEPGEISGQGNNSATVSPSAGGTSYTISNYTQPNCSAAVSNTDSGASSMLLHPNDNKGFTITYTCTPVQNVSSAFLHVNGLDGTTTIASGQSATLDWGTQNMVSCNGVSAWSGSKLLPSGSQSTGALTTGTYTYILSCAGTYGNASPAVGIIVGGVVAPPSAPTITGITSVTNCQANTISWSGYDTSQSTGFKVYRNGILVATLGNVTSYEDTSLTAGQSYTYYVKAFNANGDSVASNSVSPTASAQCAAPVPVVSLIASPPGGTVNVVNPQLTWSATNNPTFCTASGDWSGSKAVSGNNVSQGVLTSVKTYTYTLTCTNSTGVSNPVSATVKVTASALPDLTAGTPPQSVATVGTAMTFTSTISNAVSASTGSSFFNFFQVASAANGGGTISDLTAASMTALASGASNTATSPSYTFNSAGTYSVRACADKSSSGNSGTITESDETNNCSGWKNITASTGAVPVVSFWADKSSVTSGGSVTLNWTTTNSPTLCAGSSNPSTFQWNTGALSTSGGSQLITNITVNTDYSIYCQNSYGRSATQDVLITVTSAGAPVVTVTLVPTSVAGGATDQVQWTSTNNPTSCTSSSNPVNPQFNGGSLATTGLGFQNVTNNTQSTVFTVTCTNASGSGSASKLLTVRPVPTVTLVASPTSVTSGGSSVLTWTTTNSPTFCTASANPSNAQWNGNESGAGSNVTITNITAATDFNISCTNPNGTSIPADATVGITASTATINVSSNNTGGSWSITPGGLIGSGSNANYTVTPSGAGTLYTLTGNSIPNYTLAVSSTQNGVTGGGTAVTVFPGDTINYSLTYTSSGSGPVFDYNLSNSGSLAVTKGSSNIQVQEAINESLVQGTSQAVTLAVSSLPSGVSASIANNPCNPTCTGTITLTITPSTVAGTYPITVTGTSAATANKTTSFNLTINSGSVMTATLAPSSPTAYVGTQTTWTCTASGGTPPYTYSWVGTDFPGGLTTSTVNITYQTVGTKTATCTAVDAATQTAVSTQKSVQVSVNPNYQQF